MFSESRPSKFKIIFGHTIYALWCAIFLAVGVGAGWVSKYSVASEFIKQEVSNKPVEDYFEYKDHIYVLLLGCDENRSFINQQVTTKAARSDMMLVARLDFRNFTITGVSIPRDMLYEYPGYRMKKINAYHEVGGKELTQDVVERLLQIDIDRTMELDYTAFQRVVNLIGGVPIDVPKKMKWTDKAGDLYIDLEPGPQVLNGYNSMCFVRYRHSDSDYERQKRQKDFVVAFKQQLMKRPEMAPAVADESIALLGGALKSEEIVALARFARKVRPDNIKMGMIPVVDQGNTGGYGWHQTLNESDLPKTLAEFGFSESNLVYSEAPALARGR